MAVREAVMAVHCKSVDGCPCPLYILAVNRGGETRGVGCRLMQRGAVHCIMSTVVLMADHCNVHCSVDG